MDKLIHITLFPSHFIFNRTGLRIWPEYMSPYEATVHTRVLWQTTTAAGLNETTIHCRDFSQGATHVASYGGEPYPVRHDRST